LISVKFTQKTSVPKLISAISKVWSTHQYSHGAFDLYFPNFEKAPWQIQCEINGAKVNIWPGSMKAHEEFTPIPAASGIREIIVLLYGLAEPTKEETFDVVE
jgi:hypothetical protein